MSTVILSACWPLDLSPSQKLVVISLADQANDEGVCWPSMASLTRRTCLSERAVRNALRDLEAGGYLQTHYREGRSSYYTVTPARAAPRQEMPDTPAPRAPHPGTTCRTPRQQVPPEPSLNHQGTVTESVGAAAPSKMGTRLPEDWLPDPSMLKAAIDRGLTGQALRDEIDKFRNYWHAKPGKGGTKLDWGKTFHNWIITATNRGAAHGNDPADFFARRRGESLVEHSTRINRYHDERERAAAASGEQASQDLGTHGRDVRASVDDAHGRIPSGRGRVIDHCG